MPDVGAAIATALGLTGVAASVVSAVIDLAVTWGVSSALSPHGGGGRMSNPSDMQNTYKNGLGSRMRHYGRVCVGGTAVFLDAENKTFYRMVVTGQGEVHQFLEHRLNGRPVEVDGSGFVVTSPYDRKVQIEWSNGEDDQSSSTILGSAFHGEWTAAHRLRGCSRALMVCAPVTAEEFVRIYAGRREPDYTAVIESSMLYDPRRDSTRGGNGPHRLNDKSTWKFSTNAALVIADYLAHPDGYGLGYDCINWASIAREARECDVEMVTVDSRRIRKWQICGSYKMAEIERRAVLGDMLRACDGFIWQDADGLVNLQVGRWVAPTVHLTDDHIVSVTASVGGDPTESVNEVKIGYTEPRLDYTETECSPVIDADGQARNGVESQRYDIFFCPDHNQASRLAKRMLRRMSDGRWNLTLTLNLYGLNIIGERFVRASIDELAIADMTFEVRSLSLDLESGLVQIGLIEAHEDDFAFDAAGEGTGAPEEGRPPTRTETIEGDPSMPRVTNFSWNLIRNSGGRIEAWAATEQHLNEQPNLELDVQANIWMGDYNPHFWQSLHYNDELKYCYARELFEAHPEDDEDFHYLLRARFRNRQTGVHGLWSPDTAVTPHSGVHPYMWGHDVYPKNVQGRETHTSTYTTYFIIRWDNCLHTDQYKTDVYYSEHNDFKTASLYKTFYGGPGKHHYFQYTMSRTGYYNYFWLENRLYSGFSSGRRENVILYSASRPDRDDD